MSILRHFTLLSCDEIDSLVSRMSDDSWLGEIDLTLLKQAFPQRGDHLGRPPHNREAMFVSLLLMRREQIPTIVALLLRAPGFYLDMFMGILIVLAVVSNRLTKKEMN